MSQVVIENPILNSPFAEPSQHFKFADEGITNEIIEARRVSAYFVPIPKPKKKGKQLRFDTEWTQDRVEENTFVNRVRARVALWRQGGYLGVTKTTARLLERWRNPDRERKLFFCQMEAVETAIYMAEVAKKYGDAWIENELRQFNAEANPHLFRLAFKMATGSGKTVVMAMLITWHVLNKLEHTLDDLKRRREQEVTFLLAKLVLERFFRDDEGSAKPWLFPTLLPIAKRWLQECVTLKDGTFPQLLLLMEFAHDAAGRIYTSIVQSNDGEQRLRPILRPYDSVGSTRYVDFDTTRDTYATRPDTCHISHVVCDTESWEQKMAQALEDMDEVVCYAKNEHLGFTIPYTLNGEEKNYFPDFLVRVRDGNDDPLSLIIEVTGEKKKDKAAKVATARTLWAPAVNHHGGFGRWAFLEVADPWDAKNAIRASLQKGAMR